MSVADERKPDRDAEALACRRQAVAGETLCLSRSLRWVFVVLAVLVVAVILAAVLH